jgi:nucleotide-sensitive chloride channel 1A
MALETIHTSPQVEDFTLLSQHQEQTPGTFFGGKPVLHLYSPRAKVKISPEDLETQPALASLRDGDLSPDSEGQLLLENVDIWITSSYLTLVSSAQAIGVQISYPAITVHAQEGNAVLLGLNLSDSNAADEDLVFIQLRMIPTTIETHTQPTEETQEPQQPNGHATQSLSQALFKAISDCQELNPDPPEEGEDDFEDETAPGATGWIASENMQDFLDENGELRIPEGATVVGAENVDEETSPLGEGAGRTRTAAEVEDGENDGDETKWQRTG